MARRKARVALAVANTLLLAGSTVLIALEESTSVEITPENLVEAVEHLNLEGAYYQNGVVIAHKSIYNQRCTVIFLKSQSEPTHVNINLPRKKPILWVRYIDKTFKLVKRFGKVNFSQKQANDLQKLIEDKCNPSLKI